MDASEFQLIYMTTSTQAEAEAIAKVLLEKGLVACANIFPQVTSMYTWEGKAETNKEVVVFLKSRVEHFTRLKETVLDLHSYSCPCLVALPLSAGHAGFLQWLSDSMPLSPSNS